ncbi:MAG: hypothetical protein HYV27_11275 [Candidatus Hydrogenedentes bacterium]|nr:hypothetical protein [Candidatus Hydrogenedentota bacterium]
MNTDGKRKEKRERKGKRRKREEFLTTKGHESHEKEEAEGRGNGRPISSSV